jgi:thiamine pyrophosphate-dependent acetolactate synthase large subunit-like protein
MSERDVKELVVIDPEEIFQQYRFSPAQMRAALEKLEQQIEEQRLVAWTKHVANPREEASRKAYEGLCKEQGRIMTAFNRWRALNPEDAEE